MSAGRAGLHASLALLALAGLGACGGGGTENYVELGRTDKVAVIQAHQPVTAEALAQRYLDDPGLAWRIAEANEGSLIRARETAIVPLVPRHPGGILDAGFQAVTVLCYHRFTTAAQSDNALIVTEKAFADQLAYLKRHGYTVIALADLLGFLAGEADLPPKSVVITIDDGFASVHDIAYPLLKRYQMPATLFVYHDFIGGGAALSWDQVAAMGRDPLISLQSHSKTHSNLALPEAGESTDAYRQRLVGEVETPHRRLADLEDDPQFAFSFPYGDGSDVLIAILRDRGYRVAATVQRGGNTTYADPHMLRRTMIYGDDSVEAFAAKIETFQEVSR